MEMRQFHLSPLAIERLERPHDVILCIAGILAARLFPPLFFVPFLQGVL